MAGELEPGCLAVIVGLRGCEARVGCAPRPGAEVMLGRTVTVGAASPYCRCCVFVDAPWLGDVLPDPGRRVYAQWITHRANLRRIDGYGFDEAVEERAAEILRQATKSWSETT